MPTALLDIPPAHIEDNVQRLRSFRGRNRVLDSALNDGGSFHGEMERLFPYFGRIGSYVAGTFEVPRIADYHDEILDEIVTPMRDLKLMTYDEVLDYAEHRESNGADVIGEALRGDLRVEDLRSESLHRHLRRRQFSNKVALGLLVPPVLFGYHAFAHRYIHGVLFDSVAALAMAYFGIGANFRRIAMYPPPAYYALREASRRTDHFIHDYKDRIR